MTPSLATIRAKLTAGEAVTSDEVCWLVETLEAVAALLVGIVETPSGSAPLDSPTDAELAAEFGLGPDPSPDMLAYLRQFVRDRAQEEADEAQQ